MDFVHEGLPGLLLDFHQQLLLTDQNLVNLDLVEDEFSGLQRVDANFHQVAEGAVQQEGLVKARPSQVGVVADDFFLNGLVMHHFQNQELIGFLGLRDDGQKTACVGIPQHGAVPDIQLELDL